MSAYLINSASYPNPLTSVFTDGSSVWLLDTSGNVTQLSVSHGTVIQNIHLDLSNAFCIFSDGSYLWVTDNGNRLINNYGSVTQYDISSNTTIQTISCLTNIYGYVSNPTSIVSDGTYVWWTNNTGNGIGTVGKLDILNNNVTLIGNIFQSPLDITYDAQNIYVSNKGGAFVTVVSKTDDTSFNKIITPYYTTGIATNGTNLFAGTYYTNEMYEISLSNPTSISTISLTGGSAYSLALFNNTNLFANIFTFNNTQTFINQINTTTGGTDFSYSFTVSSEPNNLLTNTISTTTDNSNATVWAVENNQLLSFGLLFPPTLTSVIPGDEQFSVYWNPPPYTNGISYGIYAGYSISGDPIQQSGPYYSSPFTITDVSYGRLYNVYARVGSQGVYSAPSTTLTVTPVPRPYVVQNTNLNSPLVSVSNDGSAVWILYENGNIGQFSATTSQLLNTFRPPSGYYKNPSCIFSDGSYVWVADNGLVDFSGSVTKYNTSGQLQQSIKNPESTFINRPASLYSNGTYVWIANTEPIGGNYNIAKINASTCELITDISGRDLNDNPYNFNFPFIITYDGTNVFVVNDSGTVTQFLANIDNTIVGEIRYNDIPFFESTFVSNGTHAWFGSGGDVYKILLDNTANLTQIPVYSLPVSLSIDSSYVWVNSTDGIHSYVSQINIENDVVDSSFSFNNSGSSLYTNTISTPQKPNLGEANNFVWAVQNTNLVEIGKSPTVPDAPFITTVAPGNNQMVVYFDTPINTGGSPPITYILGYYQNGENPQYGDYVATSPITVTSLTNGTYYNTYVVAVNTLGPSVNSNIFSIYVGSPTNPTITSIIPGNGQLTVNFTPPSNNNGSPITSYSYSLNGAAAQPANQSSSPIVITGLNNGTSYNVSIFATNANGPGQYSNAVQGIPQVNPPCFKKGTKILTYNGYVPIENLKKGDLVKTAKNGFVPLHAIGVKQIYHSPHMGRSPNALYKCSKQNYPELLEDLFITGYHAILVDDFHPGQREKTLALLGDVYITGDKYRLPACIDDRTTLYEEEGDVTIYHFALENTIDYRNYGIYANGLLVETCSKRYLKEYSSMNMI